MKTTFFYSFLFMLLAFSSTAQTTINDTDGDTYVRTEQVGDEDKIRFGTAGTQRLMIYNNANNISLFDVNNSYTGVFFGQGAGASNTSGGANTGIGYYALGANTTGYRNTAVGFSSMGSNTSGNFNTAVGQYSLGYNTTGSHNVAIGQYALLNSLTGGTNTALGYAALYANTSGTSNIATGYFTLGKNTTGVLNAGYGYYALNGNTTGSFNVGMGALTAANAATNSQCSFLGYGADNNNSTGRTNSTALGAGARITANNQVRIGSTVVSSIGGYANWTNVSDARYKTDVKENVPGLEFILKLRPVTYHLDINGLNKKMNMKSDEILEAGTREKETVLYTGFLAQEVEDAALGLGYDFSGVDVPQNEESLYGLRYAEFVVPMTKAIQEQQAQIEAQQAEIEELKALVSQLVSAQTRGVGAASPSVSIWPNPVGSQVQVEISGAGENARITLHAEDGSLLQEIQGKDGQQAIDMSNWPAGMYYIQVAANGMLPTIKPVVKQ
jgi:hypothetical protein